MRHRTLFFLLVMGLLLLSTACELLQVPPSGTEIPQSTQKLPGGVENPTEAPRATSTETQVVIPTDTPVPTLVPDLQLVSTQMQDDVWFTYPSELWFSTSDPVFPNLQSKKYAECQIYLNNGHGMPDSLIATTQDETIEGIKFSVTILRPIGSDDIVFKSYQMGDIFQYTIENPGFEVLNEQCLKEGEDVLRHSLKKDFKP